MEDTIKGFMISTIFIAICSVALILFLFHYPAINGKTTVLVNDPSFNASSQELINSLGTYQSEAISEVNVSSASDPTVSAQGIELVSTVSNTRSLTSRLTGTFNATVVLVSNSLGLSSGEFIGISGALISIFLIAGIYFSIKLLRQGQ